MAKEQIAASPLEAREFRSPEHIDSAIRKLQRRIQELEQLDVRAGILNNTGVVKSAKSNLQETIREVFGSNSPEFGEFQSIEIWAGPRRRGMSEHEAIHATDRGRVHIIGRLQGFVRRLEEKLEDARTHAASPPRTYLDRLNLHPRIQDVSRDRFIDGYPWDAVFAASKALINYVKERSGTCDLDGAALVRAVFSKNDPILAFNGLGNQTEIDEQEGIMHLFEGAVLAIRNVGGHSFPEGSEQRAIEYISFLSLLAYRVQEAVVRRKPRH